jgi:6,7-dimethyl-8-ribityllumazine synthase
MRTLDESKTRSAFPIAFVVSRFNPEITGALLEGALVRSRELGFTDQQMTVVWVPGAVELPIAAQRLAQLGIYDAIVVLGAVIRGETTHHHFVAEQASQGCQQVALQNDIPVIFGVLTTENEEQAHDRIGGKHGHKGKDSVDAAMEIVSVLRQIG